MLSLRLRSAFTKLRYFLRALGFELVNTLARRWNATESPKPVLRRSPWIALSRCTIHIIPCTVFLFLLPLHFSAMYLGPGFSYRRSDGLYLVLFQVAAKTLEILCVASLTTVVLHVLRHELLRDGVPLGFVGSGIFFSQANFFWSPEMFVGTLHCVRSWKRLRLLVLIIMSGLLALLIAPSAAVLLQPRSQNVPAGRTAYYLPATPDQLWPSELSGDDERSECFGEFATQNIVCPSAGLNSLRSYFQNFNTSFLVPTMMWDTFDISPLVFETLAGKIPRLINSGQVEGFTRDTTMYQPNAITATLQSALTGDWRDATKSVTGHHLVAAKEYRYADQRLSSVWTTSPQVYAKCAAPQNVSAGKVVIDFPVKYWAPRVDQMEKYGSSEWSNEKPINITISDRSRSNSLQAEWSTLPVDQFGPVSGGVLLHLPRKSSNSSRAVVPCSISASWFFAETMSDSFKNGAAWSFTDVSKSQSHYRTDLNASSAEAHEYRRLITIRDKWFRALAPQVPYENCNSRSEAFNTLERIFLDVGLSTVLDDMRSHGQSRWDSSTHTCIFHPRYSADTDVDYLSHCDCQNGAKYQLIEFVLASCSPTAFLGTVVTVLSSLPQPSPEIVLCNGI